MTPEATSGVPAHSRRLHTAKLSMAALSTAAVAIGAAAPPATAYTGYNLYHPRAWAMSGKNFFGPVVKVGENAGFTSLSSYSGPGASPGQCIQERIGTNYTPKKCAGYSIRSYLTEYYTTTPLCHVDGNYTTVRAGSARLACWAKWG